MRRLAPFVLAALFAAVVLSLSSPAWAQGSEKEEARDQIVLSGSVHVRVGEVSGDIVMFHGPARIDGIVRGAVVVFDGPITVTGVVRGDVVGLNGPVTLRKGAHVTGDVWVAHGESRVEVGAAIDGDLKKGTVLRILSPSVVAVRLAVWIAITVSTLVLGLLLLWLAPRAADAVDAAATAATGASAGWGLAMFFGLPVLAVLSLVTLVGIPFGLGLLLALAFLYSVGYVWSAWVVGRRLVRPYRHGGPRRVTAFLAGWAILRAAGLIPVAGGITWLAGALFGLGAMTVAVWRAKRAPGPPVAPPAPPPPVPATPAR